MCAIHFILDKNRQIGNEPIQAMVSSASLRGPDYSGFKQNDFGDSQVFIGANKLSITDYSDESNQPFSCEGKSLQLVYNGELYNYQDLKNEQLNSGISFESNSDTEVLYNHLAQNREIDKIQGMFSFVAVDSKEAKIIISRDPWGMKPLFYYEDEDYKIVSSQIQSILSSGLVRKTLNRGAVSEYLQYKYVIRPNTFFKNVFEWAPGKVEIEIHGNRTTHYLRVEAGNKNLDTDMKVGHISKQLDSAILRHLPQTGLPGLFLSGGVDSTLLLASLNDLGISGIPTYSFISGNDDRKHGTQDYKYAQTAAKQFGSVHNEVETHSSQWAQVDEFVSVLDQPIADSGEFMTWLLAEKGVKSSRVFFHGAGADELFLGYNRHRAYSKYLKFQKLILDIKTPKPDKMNMLPDWLGKFIWSLSGDPEVTWNRMISFADFYTIDKINDWNSDIDNLDMAIKHDLGHYLVSDVLAVTDRASMRAGMEVRLPYLDNEFASSILRISTRHRISKGPKWILKEILTKKGGKKFANRRKEGFGLPFESWLVKHSEGISNQLLIGDKMLHEFVAKQKIKYLFTQQRRGVSKSLELWALLILAKWLDRNF